MAAAVGTKQCDVVVIGAGLGGLSAAGYLAAAGKRVIVLEQHTVPGGYAHEFRRGKYRFDVSLHAIDGASPGGWAYPMLHELGVLDQVEFKRLDPFYTVEFPDHTFTVPADVFEYEAELKQQFPDQTEGIHALIDGMIRVFNQTRRFLADSVRDIRNMDKLSSQYPDMLHAQSVSWDEYMSEYLQSDQLKAVFSTLWGYYGLPPSRLNAATFILPWVSYHLYGAFYPIGGGMALSRALEKTLKARGGEIYYRQTVERIVVDKGRAVAVETQTGWRIEAEYVISNASPFALIKMVGRDHLPADYVRQIETPAVSLSSVGVYLGLDYRLGDQFPHHEYFLADDYDLETTYQHSISGQFDRSAMVMTHYTHVDTEAAPPEGSVMSLFSLAGWDYANQWGTGGDLTNYGHNPQYLEIKQAAADELIDRASKYIPDLRAHIKYMEVATPITNYRYTLNPSGAIYGTEQSVENTFMLRLNEQTPLANVFLTGAWVFAGGMSAALLSGREVARLVQKRAAHLPYLPAFRVELPAPDVAITPADSPTVVPANGLVPATPSAANGGTVPALTYEAAGSGRKIALTTFGRRAVYVLHDDSGAALAQGVIERVRAQCPDPNLLVASVVDLRRVPKLFRGIAKNSMRQAYDQAIKVVPVGINPPDYVVILPDWEGTLISSLKAAPNKVGLLALIVDAGGAIRRIAANDDLAAEIISVIDER